MKIGIVVPTEMNAPICDFLSREFPKLEAVPFPYTIISEIPDILMGHQSQADAYLFLGETARRYTESILSPTARWITIPRSSASLLRLLFRAQVDGCGMRIAADWARPEIFRLAFQEVGLTEKEASVHILPFFPYNEALLAKDANDMEALYKSGAVDFCITIFYHVRDLLRARNVPVYILQPSYDDIRAGVQRLILSYELQLSQNSQIAVIAIRTDTPMDRMPDASSYDLALEQLLVTRRIYQFARTIQAACIEQPPGGYLLFATRSFIENATDRYQYFPLLEAVRKETAFTLSVGFGYGTTADEARLHAERAMTHASLCGGDQAYLIGNSLVTPIPMSQIGQQIQSQDPRPMDQPFLQISKKTGLSLRLLSSLQRVCRDTGRRRFTSAELADLTGVTPRTMNRILQKLTDHHLCQDVGRSFTKKSGRPSRIIELLLPK